MVVFVLSLVNLIFFRAGLLQFGFSLAIVLFAEKERKTDSNKLIPVGEVISVVLLVLSTLRIILELIATFV